MYKKRFSNQVSFILPKASKDRVRYPKPQRGKSSSSPSVKPNCAKYFKKHMGKCLVGMNNCFRWGEVVIWWGIVPWARIKIGRVTKHKQVILIPVLLTLQTSTYFLEVLLGRSIQPPVIWLNYRGLINPWNFDTTTRGLSTLAILNI